MPNPPTTSSPHRVLIAGAGVAGLEALVALRSLAGEAVAISLLAPDSEFSIRALSVKDPFALPTPRRYDIARLCADHGAAFERAKLQSVDPDARTVATSEGATLPFDSLLIAVGALAEPAFGSGLTFRGLQDADAMHGLIQDVEGGYTGSVAFVVPAGATWPLPLYELALMTAHRASGLGLHPQLTLLTPEPSPLAAFGEQASRDVAEILADADIQTHFGISVRDIHRGVIVGSPGDLRLQAERVVSAARLSGPRVAGLPADPDGFIEVDDEFAVRGTSGIYAAGDGTTFPVKQGGIAAQQAETAAHAIARRAGADVASQPLGGTLRAQLLTGAAVRHLRREPGSDWTPETSTSSEELLSWPPSKVAAPYLTPYLQSMDRGATNPR